MKIELEENESESANSSDLQLNTDDVATAAATKKITPISDEQVNSDAIDEGIIILQSAEYEQETNNNDCTFYKQNLAKQALAGVF